MAGSTPIALSGIRNIFVDLRSLKAELERAAEQTTDNLQDARANSGSTVTNSATQTATLAQTATLNETKTITIAEPQPTSIPLVFQERFNYLQRNAVIGKAVDLQTTGKATNIQQNRVGQVAMSNQLPISSGTAQVLTGGQALTTGSGAANATLATPLNDLDSNSVDYVPGDQVIISGTSFNGTPYYTVFKYGPIGGATETLSGDTTFSTASGTATASTPLNSLSQNSTPYIAGDIITISGKDADGTSVSGSFRFGPTSGSQEILTGATSLFKTTGGVAGFNTRLNDLAQTTTGYLPGDTIAITGVNADGNAVSGTFTYGTAPGQDGETLGSLLTRIQSIFNAGASKNVTVGIDPAGRIIVATTGLGNVSPDLALSLVPGNNQTSFGSFSITSQGVATSYDGTTLGDLAARIGTLFPASNVTISNGKIVVTDKSGPRATDLQLALADALGNTGATSFGTFSITTEGADQDSNGTTLGDLINFVNGTGQGNLGGLDKITGATLGLSGANLVLTADTRGSTNLSISIADASTNKGKTTFGTFSVTTTGTDPTPGSNPQSVAANTLVQTATNSQVLDTRVTRRVIAQTGTQPIVVAREREITLDMDGIKTLGVVNSTQDSGSLAPTTNPTSNTQSFQVARSNAGPTSNYLSQVAMNTVSNTVVDEYFFDFRRISTITGTTQTAELTPRSMTIAVRTNQDSGLVNSVINTGAAVQRQALVQVSEGGVDESGKVTQNGGTSSNIASQYFRHTDTSNVSQSTSVLI